MKASLDHPKCVKNVLLKVSNRLCVKGTELKRMFRTQWETTALNLTELLNDSVSGEEVQEEINW